MVAEVQKLERRRKSVDEEREALRRERDQLEQSRLDLTENAQAELDLDERQKELEALLTKQREELETARRESDEAIALERDQLHERERELEEQYAKLREDLENERLEYEQEALTEIRAQVTAELDERLAAADSREKEIEALAESRMKRSSTTCLKSTRR